MALYCPVHDSTDATVDSGQLPSKDDDDLVTVNVSMTQDSCT